jgi:hypothetical protein
MPGWRPTSDNWEVVTAAIDPFLGSGSTLIAVDKTGRICRGVELDPLYVDVIVWRYESATDNRAILPAEVRGDGNARALEQAAVWDLRFRFLMGQAGRLFRVSTLSGT